MVSSCSAVDCTNRYVKGVGFFRFPSDPLRRKLWINAVRRKDWMPSNTSVLCGDHFQTGRPSRDEKHPDYVPSIFSYNSPQLIIAKKRKKTEIEKISNDLPDYVPSIFSYNSPQLIIAEKRKKTEIEKISNDHNYIGSSEYSINAESEAAEGLLSLKDPDKMRMCCVPFCRATAAEKEKISFFRFPANFELRESWIRAVVILGKSPTWRPTENSVVCNKHFLNSDFSISTSRKRLLPNVIPSVFEDYDAHNLLEPSSKKKPLLIRESEDLDFVMSDDQHNSEIIYSCCVLTCKNRCQKGTDLSFFKFPTELKREKLWNHCLQQKNCNSAEKNIICGAHFQTGRPSNDPNHPDYIPNKFIKPVDKVDSHSSKHKKDDLIVEMDVDTEGPSEYIISETGENFETEETILKPEIMIKDEQEACSIIKQIEDDIRKKFSDEMQRAVQNSEIPKDDDDELLNLKLELNQAYTDINILTKIKDKIAKELSAAYDRKKILINTISKKEEELLNMKLELKQANADIKILLAEKDSFVKELEKVHSKQQILEYTISENQEKLEKDLEQAYAEVDALRKERDMFQEKLTAAHATRGILHDPNKLRFYTGLNSTKDFFSIVMNFCDLERDFKTISVETKFLIVLMRLRVNLFYKDLGYRFDISGATVERLCDKTIPILETKLKELINNPVDDVSSRTLSTGPKMIVCENLLQRIRKYSKNVNKQFET